MKLKF